MDTASLLRPVPRAWWHPGIENAFRIQQCWKAELSFQQNKVDGSMELEQFKQRISEEVDIFHGDPSRGVRGQICKASKTLQQVRSDCFKKRQEYLEKNAMLLVHEEDPTKKNETTAKVVMRMRNKERSCKMYKTIKMYLKAAQKAAL
eukprot:14083931-Ditylum_brightwellii.AAC.1